MRRFLVVGCGGTGAATLAYMMDQLRSDLPEGVDELPSGWQFVVVDVPSAPGKGPDGMGNVREQGVSGNGRYIALGHQGLGYEAVDRNISTRLGGGTLSQLGTWAPRDPRLAPKQISEGAGQMRAIGRAALLNKVPEVFQSLQQAWRQLLSAGTEEEMSRLSRAASDTFESANSPLVLVIGSMAGGSGASMALDVCRLVSQIEGVSSDMVALFLASADTFDALPASDRAGVRPNALAMLGEIIAAQTGAAADHDRALLGSLGVQLRERNLQAFKRVFPVGRSGQGGAVIGGGEPRDVFRALGRGLAALMSSGPATEDFISYDLTNRREPSNLEHFGWGADQEDLCWSSFGFASLTMGRERYAEYAAQRIARVSVDRLLDGHVQPNNPATPTDQAEALVQSQWTSTLARLELPESAEPVALRQWMQTTAMPLPEIRQHIAQTVEQELGPYLTQPNGQNAAQWGHTISAQLSARGQILTRRADDAAYRWSFDWHQHLLDRLQIVVAEAVSRFGLGYAQALLGRIRNHVDLLVSPLRQVGAVTTPAPTMPSGVRTALARFRGLIQGGDGFLDEIVESVLDSGLKICYTSAANRAAEALVALGSEVVGPLIESITTANVKLSAERGARAGLTGLAMLKTDQYASWPTEGTVPRRFETAYNEITLTPISEFSQFYAAHLASALPTSTPEQTVARAVVSGEWESIGASSPGGLLSRTRAWHPAKFLDVPGGGETLSPSLPSFELALTPGQILDRARAFVDRPDGAFQEFCGVSLYQHLARGDQTAVARTLLDKFNLALNAARPLTGVDPEMVRETNRVFALEYKFSAIPLRGLDLATTLRHALAERELIGDTVPDRFDKALTDDKTSIRRIDIFGAYPPYLPLVYNQMLNPIDEQWARVSKNEHERSAFWLWRRSRPLPASLPMAAVERQAMVAGWYIGLITGDLRLPAKPYAAAVQIRDDDPGQSSPQWVDFPKPMLTEVGDFLATYDWLPAVLESYLIAVAQAHRGLGVLRPYRLLRGLYHNQSTPAANVMVQRSGITRLATWLADGQPGSRVPVIGRATTAADRLALAKQWLRDDETGPGHLARTHFLPTGTGSFANVTTRQQASKLPYFADLAQDIDQATTEVAEMLDRAAEQTLEQGPGPDLPTGGEF